MSETLDRAPADITPVDITPVVIIGSGPAACTAAIYAARADLKPIMVTGYEQGGQLTTTPEVGHWPGALGAPSGFDLMNQMLEHVKALQVKLVYDLVTAVDFTSDPKVKQLTLSSGEVLSCRAVIIATGARARYLGIDLEDKFKGKGVSACATCDGMFFRNKEVAVVGGGSVAFIEALFLANLCSKVYLIHRREGFRAEQVLVERVNDKVKEGKIELLLNTKVVSYLGDETLSGVELDTKGERRQLPLQGLFVAIGHSPATDIFKGQLELDEQGYIVTDPSTTPASATSVHGVFAAGDCASREYHQAIVAAGAGCKAALDAEQYLLGIA